MYPWGIDYYALNFQSTVSDHAAIFKQLYFREALAYLMNQASVIKGPLRGYGAVTVGPVAATPPTSFLSATGKQGDPFPFNPGKAKSLLASHGWNVVAGGVTTCTDAAKCGPGITTGTGLSFNFVYEGGVSWVTSEMTQLQANAAAIGIKLNLVPKPFNQVIAIAGGNCVTTKVPCNWDMANWGFGWSFSPDYLPTGEELFMCGAPANSGGYCDKNNDALINQTLTSSNLQTCTAGRTTWRPSCRSSTSRTRPTPCRKSPTTCTGPPAEPDAQHHPRELVFREMTTGLDY